jgi:arylsulfatase A-like enzyme
MICIIYSKLKINNLNLEIIFKNPFFFFNKLLNRMWRIVYRNILIIFENKPYPMKSLEKFIYSCIGIITFSMTGQTLARAAGERDNPNILIILVDDLGYGDLSINGGEDIHTPNIDKLFEKGMRFTNFYANCTVCSPTRASLMTGRYPDLAGVPGVIRTNETNSWGYLVENAVTLPQILKSLGYQTALIGKWHLGLESPNTPNERGFDFFHGFLGDMMDDYWTHLRQGNNYMRLNREIIEPEGHATDIFSDWAIEYLKESEKKESPFFLYLAYNAPHFPIQPPEDWLKKVQQREKGISEKRAKNVALVEHLDDGIGRVLEALEETRQDRNTLIIFSSDNGGHLPSGASNGKLRGGKQDMYEGGIKVPTCFVWKEDIKSGTVCENLGLTMDIFPTLCEITGVEIPDNINGLSLYRSLQEKDQVTDNRVVYFMRREGGFYGGLCYYAARQGQYKLLQNTPFEPMQLFNLKTDPGERIPLQETSDKFKDLKYMLSQHIREAGKVPWQK